MKFSEAFQTLVARNDANHLLNQACQLTQKSLRHLNLKLFVKFIKIDGFLIPHRGGARDFTILIFKPGILQITDVEEEKQLRI